MRSASIHPGRSRRGARQARTDHPDGGRDPDQHREPDGAEGGLQGQCRPPAATADVDGRFLPGHEEEFLAEVDELLGTGVKREFIQHDMALETTFDGDLCAAMSGALLAEDPGARIVPYCLSGGTDAKLSAAWASGASASARSGSLPTWTSLACSTASMSGCRSSRCASGSAYWTFFSTAASATHEARQPIDLRHPGAVI